MHKLRMGYLKCDIPNTGRTGQNKTEGTSHKCPAGWKIGALLGARSVHAKRAETNSAKQQKRIAQ